MLPMILWLLLLSPLKARPHSNPLCRHSCPIIHLCQKEVFLVLAFRHEYPLDPKAGLGTLMSCLKGNDAIIQRVCSQLSLQTMLRVVYADENRNTAPYFVMVKDIVDYSEQCDINIGIGEVMTE